MKEPLDIGLSEVKDCPVTPTVLCLRSIRSTSTLSISHLTLVPPQIAASPSSQLDQYRATPMLCWLRRDKKKKMLITDKDQHTLGLGVHAVGAHASCGCRTEMHARAEKEDRGLPVLRK